MRRPMDGLLVPLMVVFVLGFVVRIYSLVWSHYPYNIDGFIESVMATDIYNTHSLVVPEGAPYAGSYVIHMPFFNSVLAMASGIMGVEPLFLAQLLVATIGALSCVLLFLLLHNITDSRRVALLGGLFMALLGTYVFCTASVWKEALGLTLLVLVAALFLERRDIRLRILLTALLIMMTFVHHHSAVMTYMFFSFATVGEAYLAGKNRKWSNENNADIATMIFLWPLAVIYYSGINLPYYDFLTPDTGMYLMIAVSCAMAFVMTLFLFEKREHSKRHYLKIVIPLIGGSLLVFNYLRPIFPGIAGTTFPVLIIGLAYIALLVPMWFGAGSILIPNRRHTVLLYALIFGPLSMILFSLLRGFDATSHMIIYRTFDFLDIAMACMFATGAIIIIRELKRYAPSIIGVLLLILLSTTPLAFQTQELFNVHNHTYEYEVDSMLWLDDHSYNATLDSDQRLGTVYAVLTGSNGSHDLGTRIDAGLSVQKFDLLMAKNTWTISGAQEFPFGQTIIDEQVFYAFIEERTLIYVGGPIENQLFIFTPE